jgi:hypothetical protein
METEMETMEAHTESAETKVNCTFMKANLRVTLKVFHNPGLSSSVFVQHCSPCQHFVLWIETWSSMEESGFLLSVCLFFFTFQTYILKTKVH